MHCFNEGLLITFRQFYLKKRYATRSKCLSQLHCVHSQVTNRGPKMVIYPLVVDENGYAPRYVIIAIFQPSIVMRANDLALRKVIIIKAVPGSSTKQILQITPWPINLPQSGVHHCTSSHKRFNLPRSSTLRLACGFWPNLCIPAISENFTLGVFSCI